MERSTGGPIVLPPARHTRFAPAPTGFLHLGHVANAIWVWGVARSVGADVLLRIEDHDRQRSRGMFDAAILEDLEWLEFHSDDGPVRQSDPDAAAAYRSAADGLARDGLVYACACTRSTFAAWAREHGRDWRGPGCPAACRTHAPRDGSGLLRVALGDGTEAFDDLLVGRQIGEPSATGDPVIRDRAGNWSYGFAVVIDDLRQDVDLVVRGEDLLADTFRQIRLAALVGGSRPRFLHHPLIRKASGAKLSKSDGDTGVRDLRQAGWSAADVRRAAGRLGEVPLEVFERAADSVARA